MEPWHVFLILFLLVVVKNVVQAKRNPPRELHWDEVPEELRFEVERSLPGLEIVSVVFVEMVGKYRLEGRYRGRPAKVDLELNRAGQLREIEYEDEAAGKVLKQATCQLSDLPAEVITHMGDLLGEERQTFQPSLVCTARMGQEPAFEIKGRSEHWRWEFEFDASGLLVELEKDVRS